MQTPEAELKQLSDLLHQCQCYRKAHGQATRAKVKTRENSLETGQQICQRPGSNTEEERHKKKREGPK